MGFRYQRSMKLIPGVRLNFSKRGIGMSLGVPGARISFSPGGRVTRRVGLPGTGMSWVSSSSGSRRRSTRSVAPVAPAQPPAPPSPGLFASADERNVYSSFRAKNVDTLLAVSQSESKAAVLAGFYAALILSDQDNHSAALHALDTAWHRIADFDHDELFAKYAHAMTVTVDLCEDAKVSAPGSRDTAGLLYAELLQAAGRPSEALEVVKHLTWGPAVAISSADLMAAMSDWDGVLTVTNNIAVIDDGTALIAVYRAMAFRRTGLLDAAKECLKPALAARIKDAGVRSQAMLERARIQQAQGHFAAARKDVESVLAKDAANTRAKALLAELGSSTDEAATTPAPRSQESAADNSSASVESA